MSQHQTSLALPRSVVWPGFAQQAGEGSLAGDVDPLIGHIGTMRAGGRSAKHGSLAQARRLGKFDRAPGHVQVAPAPPGGSAVL
jgi:hypothetical protein